VGLYVLVASVLNGGGKIKDGDQNNGAIHQSFELAVIITRLALE